MSFHITRLDQKNRTHKAKQYSRWLEWRKKVSNQVALAEFMPVCPLYYNNQRDDYGRFLPGINHPMKTKELREKSRLSHKGQVPWSLGKAGTYHFSEQAKKNMSIAQKARPKHINSINALKLASKKRIGLPLPLEVRQKMKIARRHRKLPRIDTIPEKILQKALTMNNIEFEKHRQDITGYPDLLINMKICVFVDGDYFHCNPNKYNENTKITGGKIAKNIWAYDEKINKILLSEGFIVLRFWESDIKKNAQFIIEKIREVM